MSAAGPARHAVDHHRAASTHANAAGEPVAERRVNVLLHPGHDVQNRLVLMRRDIKNRWNARRVFAALNRDFEGPLRHDGWYLSKNETAPVRINDSFT